VLRHSKIITYADDTVIYLTGKSKEDIENHLNTDFCALISWLESMQLVCNMKKGKTEAMLFGTSYRIKDQSLVIQHRFNHLSCTPTYKYLGVKLKQTLSLRDHIDSAYRKASGRLYLLKRVCPKLTINAALTLYKSMILPTFTCCSILTSMFTNPLRTKFIALKEDHTTPSTNASILPILVKSQLELFKSVDYALKYSTAKIVLSVAISQIILR